MTEDERRKRYEMRLSDIEEFQEVMSIISREVPVMIKGIVGSIFSEEAGREMGRAAASFYAELKAGGIPEETALKMTENYMKIFTDMGDLIKGVMEKRGYKGETKRKEMRELGEEISRLVMESVKEKLSKEIKKKER